MTDSIRLRNATGLYLEGIRDGNPQAALDKYIGERYTQHSTGVADGKEGFLEFFTPFLERNLVRDIQLVRAIEDGQYVFLHAYQNLNDGEDQWVTADLFDTDGEGKIVEHWDVIGECIWPTTSGRSMVNGPTEVEDLEQTDANKAVMQGFVDEVLLGGDLDKASEFISDEEFAQHHPRLEDGLASYREFLEKVNYQKVHRMIGQGNFVVLFSEVQKDGGNWAFFDIFRLADGKLVELWNVTEQIGPPETWNNSGKF